MVPFNKSDQEYTLYLLNRLSLRSGKCDQNHFTLILLKSVSKDDFSCSVSCSSGLGYNDPVLTKYLDSLYFTHLNIIQM